MRRRTKKQPKKSQKPDVFVTDRHDQGVVTYLMILILQKILKMGKIMLLNEENPLLEMAA